MLNLRKDPTTGKRIRKPGMDKEQYLDAIFDAHRTRISEVYGANARAEFKQSIEDIIGTKYHGRKIRNVDEALTVLRREEVFTPKAANFAESVLSRVRELGGTQELLRATRDKSGHFQKMDTELLKWNKQGRYHEYRGLHIYAKESPYAAKITDATGNIIWISKNWEED